jgi:hypothetical protein
VTRRLYYGWFVTAAAFITLLITVGVPFYGLPFFYDYFIKEFGWSRGQTTSGIALATISPNVAPGHRLPWDYFLPVHRRKAFWIWRVMSGSG